MLARRLRRDVKERGRTVDGTLDQLAFPMLSRSFLSQLSDHLLGICDTSSRHTTTSSFLLLVTPT